MASKPNLTAGLDLAVRASILEGALSYPPGTLMAIQPEKLKQVLEDQLAPQGPIHPDWCSLADQGLWTYWKMAVAQFLESTGSSADLADDIMQAALTRLGRKGTAVDGLFQAAGGLCRKRILAGKAPFSMLSPSLGDSAREMLRRKALSEVVTARGRKGTLRGLDLDLRLKDSAHDNFSTDRRSLEMFDILRGHDLLARQVQDSVRGIWKDWTPARQEYLNWWLDNFIETGFSAGSAEIAKHFVPDVPADMAGKPGVPTPTDVIKWRRGLQMGEINRAWQVFKDVLPQFQAKFWQTSTGQLVDDRLLMASIGQG